MDQLNKPEGQALRPQFSSNTRLPEEGRSGNDAGVFHAFK